MSDTKKKRRRWTGRLPFGGETSSQKQYVTAWRKLGESFAALLPPGWAFGAFDPDLVFYSPPNYNRTFHVPPDLASALIRAATRCSRRDVRAASTPKAYWNDYGLSAEGAEVAERALALFQVY